MEVSKEHKVPKGGLEVTVEGNGGPPPRSSGSPGVGWTCPRRLMEVHKGGIEVPKEVEDPQSWCGDPQGTESWPEGPQTEQPKSPKTSVFPQGAPP